MSKKQIYFIIIIFLIKNSNTKDNPLPIELKDLLVTSFSMNNQYVIFEYNNTEQRVFNSSINFLFSKVKNSSATVYIYDSFDKIKMKDGEFINYLNKTSLANTKYFRINYDDYFYRDNCIFYIVLYDNSPKYDDNIKVVNSLKYLDFG